MTVREEIALIQKERYGNYEGRLLRNLGKLHELIRLMQGDEGLLKFLKEAEEKNPKPSYKPPPP